MKMSATAVCDPLAIEIPKKPLNKSASEHRKATKPLMEKRRRARINNSLNILKSLILDATNKDPSRHSKLEKADILEMTVRHIKDWQKRLATEAIVCDPNVRSKFKAGYSECALEVKRFLSSQNDVDDRLKQRLINHLSLCETSVNNALHTVNSPFAANIIAFPGMVPPPGSTNNPLRVQIPYPSLQKSPNDINNNQTIIESKLTTPPSSTSSTLFTFTFPPHHMPQNLQSPQTPNTPTTPSNRALSININYNNSLNNQASLNCGSCSPIHYRLGSIQPWSHGADSPVQCTGSISPASNSVRSLSPAGSDSHDVDMTAEAIDRRLSNNLDNDNSKQNLSHSPASNGVWRP
ncbi:deadpan-like protein, partial [Dinothrombium tinctorium]